MRWRILYTLLLGFCLTFSSKSDAITFAFQVNGGDTDLVDFSARLSLDPVGRFAASASIGDGGEFFINADRGFQRFEMTYNFRGTASADILLTPTLFQVAELDLDQVTVRQGSTNAQIAHGNATVSMFGISPGGLFGLWTLNFGTDNDLDPRPRITGTFVQQVPEPGTLGLVALGFVVTIRLSRRQTRLRDS